MEIQEIFYVAADDYSDLVNSIENLILEMKDTHKIHRINYFNMEEEAEGKPTAIILFNPTDERL